ncbi:MAG TPA: hypothetical protein VKS20_04270 [Candidatus Acidoferrales bacterium]|nr:hypothetical protein [Candidatus Acidoferrales bacterium]
MRVRLLFAGCLISAALLPLQAAMAQCKATELVRGAGKYNKLVCDAYAQRSAKHFQQALSLFLTASREPLFEVPNIQLLAPIAETYADLGQFREAERYLQYDNLALLWELGIAGCDQGDSELTQGGKSLTSDEAKHVANLVCGAAFENFTEFGNRTIEDLIPVANAMLRHDAIRREILAKQTHAKKGEK